MSAETMCPECHAAGQTLGSSTLPGFLACKHCGKVFPGAIEELRRVELDELGEVPVDAEGNPLDLAEEDLKIPDSIEMEIGWRAWAVNPDFDPARGPVLRSATRKEAFWTPGVPMIARCPFGKGRANGKVPKGEHEVPGEKCKCGLYAAKTHAHMIRQSYRRYNAEKDGWFKVIGKVKQWGKVIEGTQGWRAQRAYPQVIYMPFEAFAVLGKAVGEAYKVPVYPKNILNSEELD